MRPEQIIVHHSSSPDDGYRSNWNDIRRWHVDHNGWVDIGYHAGVESIGGVYEALMGRPWDVQGAHCLGHNANSLGICFVGNWNDAAPPEDQLRTGARLIKLWMRTHGITIDRVLAHRDYSSTDCPGRMFDMERLKFYVRETQG